MAAHELAMWVLEQCDACETKEALVGDLLEEISRGRSTSWVWLQVLAYGRYDLARRVRHFSPRAGFIVAFAPTLLLLGAASVMPSWQVFEMWGIVYAVSGTFSLFGHLLDRPLLADRRVDGFVGESPFQR